MMAHRQTESLRRDAQQKRARILAVAIEAFTESSTASLNSIAKKAGVGIGTLYRNFPTREVLVLEVYRHEVQQLVDAAPGLLATMPPLDALRAWLDSAAHYGMTKAGLADAFSTVTTSHEGLAAETYELVLGALSLLLHANEQVGTIRAGLDPADVLTLMSFLWRIEPIGDWRSRSDRLLDLFMDGLRTGAPRPTTSVDC
ncbi:TetR/AcrR family transcriptional regulator [Dictyobacter arantiisoli]|uniref:TetR family transcriptional regulator n=1 Tax=Dictyobacter arantiisoli TaxID=2014874 RepID=A0A5A5TBC0_9CHLR|nr:TetR/AcrR family transcriptional regulator [Dictyobacter arantiisoli]GCF08657.1 TetR family transcriptional regulator [Dictyobacter arantiisoli]